MPTEAGPHFWWSQEAFNKLILRVVHRAQILTVAEPFCQNLDTRASETETRSASSWLTWVAAAAKSVPSRQVTSADAVTKGY